MLDGLDYKYLNVDSLKGLVFKESNDLPVGYSVVSTLSVPILNNKVFLIKQKNIDKWDIPFVNIEINNNWLDIVNSKLNMQLGIVADHHEVLGYFELPETKNKDLNVKNVVLVSLCFVQNYTIDVQKQETLFERKLVSFSKLKDNILDIENHPQYHKVFLVAKDKLDSLNLLYEFSFVRGILDSSLLVTQVYGFCKDLHTGKFCVVRETGQKHFSLPGGGCEIGETPEGAFKRELYEETLLVANEIVFLGATKVDIYASKNKNHLQTIYQARFYTEISEVVEFFPNNAGFEIEERLFVDLPELKEKIDWLKTEVGFLVMEEVNKLK